MWKPGVRGPLALPAPVQWVLLCSEPWRHRGQGSVTAARVRRGPVLSLGLRQLQGLRPFQWGEFSGEQVEAGQVTSVAVSPTL